MYVCMCACVCVCVYAVCVYVCGVCMNHFKCILYVSGVTIS